MVNIQGPDKIKIAKDKKVTLFMGVLVTNLYGEMILLNY